MFIDNRLQTKLRSIDNAIDFINFLKPNYNYIHNMKDDFMQALVRIANTNPIVDTSILELLFYDRESVTETEFDLLERYIDTVSNVSKGVTDSQYCDRNYLALLLLNSNFSNFSEYGNVFMQKIMDLYVPCNEPENIVQALLSQCPMEFGLCNIIKNAHNTSYFMNEIVKGDTTEYIDDALLLFKYISDIFTNRSFKESTFVKLHLLETGPVTFFKNQNKLADIYQKYFKDDIYSAITDLGITFQFKNETSLKSELLDFIEYYKTKFNVPLSILQVFAKDVLSINQKYIDAYHYATISDTLRVIWKIHENEQDVSSILDTLTPTLESKTIGKLEGLDFAIEAFKKDSVAMHKTSDKIYHAYKSYKNAEDKVDSQITKAVNGMKGVLIGDVKTEIIEGKKFSAIGMLKQLLGTVGLFAFGPIKAAIALVLRYTLKKSTTIAERKKIIMELESEIEMINEKIDDAKSDNDREAKYSMMRTKTELTNALNRIRYGLEADERSLSTAKGTLNSIRGK